MEDCGHAEVAMRLNCWASLHYRMYIFRDALLANRGREFGSPIS